MPPTTTPSYPSSLSSKILASILFLVVVYVAYYTYNNYQAKNAAMNLSLQNLKIADARNALYSGDYVSAKAKFEEALRGVTDKAMEGKIKIFYGGTMFMMGESASQKQGVEIIKSVTLDKDMPAYVKMLAYNSIANLFVRGRSKESYLTYFNEEPYIGFLPVNSGTSETSDINTAYKKILELSDTVYPNSYAEYAIAGDYYAPMMASIATSSPEKIEEGKKMAAIAQDYIKKGDAKNDKTLYAPDLYLWSKLNKALGLNASSKMLNNVSLEEREVAFKEAYQAGLDDKDISPSSLQVLYRIRFFYANFLREYYGDARKEDITKILAEFGTAATGTDKASNGIRAFFLTHATNAKSPVHIFATKLAAYSPEFKSFLITAGYAF